MNGVTAPIAAPLDVAYLDTAPRDLSFALGLPPHPALATRDVVADGLRVHLRLLGASHQVFAGPVRETVACLGAPGPEPTPAAGAPRSDPPGTPDTRDATGRPDATGTPGTPDASRANAPGGAGDTASVAGEALPVSAAEELDGWSYQFRARTVRYTGSAFHSQVSRLRGRLGHSRMALIGVFPGDDHAVTAMVVRPGGRRGPLAGGCPQWRTAKPYAEVDRPLRERWPATGPVQRGPGGGRRQVAWRTWHTYPQTGEIVETHSWMTETHSWMGER